MGNDPFDADVGCIEQRGNKLIWQVLGEISEEVGGDQNNASSLMSVGGNSSLGNTPVFGIRVDPVTRPIKLSGGDSTHIRQTVL